jgi:hypothetical protein
MSKIKFEQIHEDVVEVFIPSETPMDMVEQLTKSLSARGLVEDKTNSTLSTRYFYRPTDKANELADELIKSLKGLAKDENYWSPKAQFAHQKKLREKAIADRRAKLNPTPAKPMNVSNKPGPNSSPSGKGAIPFDSPTTAGGTGKRYAYINDPVNKVEEHPGDCECGICETVEKSGYGPKGMAQYSEADNARRKTNNVGIERVHAAGHNAAIKQYSRNIPAGSQTDPKMKRRQPVTQWTPEQIAAENAKRGLKKSWGEHLPFPSAEEEIMRLAGVPTENGEDAMANQLANMMQSKSMLNHKNPSRDEFIAAGEAMGLGVSEEVAKSAEQQWSGAINNWLAEATKPISQRFASEEEELAYWNNIKVGDTGGDHGY